MRELIMKIVHAISLIDVFVFFCHSYERYSIRLIAKWSRSCGLIQRVISVIASRIISHFAVIQLEGASLETTEAETTNTKGNLSNFETNFLHSCTYDSSLIEIFEINTIITRM